jgi:hypothetical protein
VEAIVRIVLEVADNNHRERMKPRDTRKLIMCLKSREACGIYGIPNYFFRKIFGAYNIFD